MSNEERSFVMIKPDATRRKLIGRIIQRFEDRNYKIVAMKMLVIPEDQAQRHYAEHREKSFWDDLIGFITSGPVVAMVIEGRNAVEYIRVMMGATDAGKALPGTIRGDFSASFNRNIIHGSDSIESAKREIENFFDKKELIEW